MTEVSGNHKIARKAKPHEWKDVRLAVISYSGLGAQCSCGWVSRQARRLRVLEDSIDRHLAKRHQGKGIRL